MLKQGDIFLMVLHLKKILLLRKWENLYFLPKKKLLINTINAHSYNIAQKDTLFAKALIEGAILLADGFSIVIAKKWLNKENVEHITGVDLFTYEMEELNQKGGLCFFLGSNENVLSFIKQHATIDYPNIQVVTYSPPYKSEFTEEENSAMIQAINNANPDLLWIGMTAPKQEKWAYIHYNELNVDCHIGTIGAVFDFYAGTIKRAPLWWQNHGLEWLYRLIKEPRRMWRRYIIGNMVFILYMCKEKVL
ncbi:putative N-acetylmannosaminyltransferase [termite gut metagenome]|uniref:Putative N-acetylmannosaminyltransferase n=1 Tax=termite gut metagenome TaxID=433724 RepID=A0A5J4QTJ8_9ZZZZ